MARPDACAKFAVRDDSHGVAMIIHGSNYLIKRVATKRDVRFHGVLSRRGPPACGGEGEEVECCERARTASLAAPPGPICWTPSDGKRFPVATKKKAVPLLRSSYVSCAVVTQPLR